MDSRPEISHPQTRGIYGLTTVQVQCVLENSVCTRALPAATWARPASRFALNNLLFGGRVVLCAVCLVRYAQGMASTIMDEPN
jgi:hypothetical protein